MPRKVPPSEAAARKRAHDFRTLSARPYRPWKLQSEAGRHRLVLGDSTVEWWEADAPGLVECIAFLLKAYHGTWHLARAELTTHAKRVAGGAKRASASRQEAVKHDAALAAAAKKELRGNPRLTDSDIARRLADRGHGGFDAIRKKLPRLLGRKS